MDHYKTVEKALTEAVLLKEKGSKFLGYVFPITDENEVKPIIESLKKEHHTARHWCYAFQIGTTTTYYRANDDGEPNHSAGTPIYGQIQSFGITNVLVVVVRYFGGTKLGVGGLITAYKTTAQMALEQAEIIEKTIHIMYQIVFSYKDMSKVMRIIKEKKATIITQDLQTICTLTIAIPKALQLPFETAFEALFEVSIKTI